MEYADLPNFFAHTVTHSQNSYLSVHQIGRDKSTAGFSYPHYNNHYVISIVKSGKGVLESGGKKYYLSQNDVFISMPDELSIQTADQNKPWELCFVSFGGSAADELINSTIFKNGNVTATLKSNALANEIIKATVFLNSNTTSDFLLLEYFFKFLSYLDTQKLVPAPIDNKNENKYVAEMKKYIQANYLNTIKISDIATKLSVNRSHLYRIFKKETGTSIEDYIINIRMTHAKTLLTTTNMTVSDIANAVGYKNYSTFLKRFKQDVGLTPLEYKKESR